MYSLPVKILGLSNKLLYGLYAYHGDSAECPTILEGEKKDD